MHIDTAMKYRNIEIQSTLGSNSTQYPPTPHGYGAYPGLHIIASHTFAHFPINITGHNLPKTQPLSLKFAAFPLTLNQFATIWPGNKIQTSTVIG